MFGFLAYGSFQTLQAYRNQMAVRTVLQPNRERDGGDAPRR